MKIRTEKTEGSTLVVTIVVVATLLVLLGVAVDYSTQISRTTQRSRKTALAMEIADGHLETLFTSWRNIYRTTWTATYGTNTGGSDYSVVGTNYFYTTCASCSPSPVSSPAATPVPSMVPSGTPPKIPLPATTNFPTEASYTVSQYRVQAVDPMITLDGNENAMIESSSSKTGTNYGPMSPASTPPAGYGPNTGPGGYNYPYSYFYLAAVDVSVPTQTGSVKAKVRRVFEKKFDLPWTYAMFFVDDLELQPSTPISINGPIHTNASLYIGNNNFTAGSPTYSGTNPAPTSGRVEYGTDYVNGYSPKDPRYPGSGFTSPNFAKSSSSLSLSDCPPSQVAPYLPFGWNVSLGTGANNSGYHEIIERPAASPSPDPLAAIRYYNQAGYRIVIDSAGGVTVKSVSTTGVATDVPSATYNTFVGNNGQGSNTTILKQNMPLYDAREGAAVKVTNVDISKLVTAVSGLAGWTGLLYLADAGGTTYNADGTVKTAGTAASVTVNNVTTSTTKRAFRLLSGSNLPSPGLTIVSENPIYIQGNYNTGYFPPSNSGTYTSPTGTIASNGTGTAYVRVPAAIVADAVTVLSNGWLDSASSTTSPTSRAATANITINAALVSGNVPSNGTSYSGGGENFTRLLEDWSTKTFCYYGSIMQLFGSRQAMGPWTGTNYVAPQTTAWYYDYSTFSDSAPPGYLTIAAYLQQQRWYQVY